MKRKNHFYVFTGKQPHLSVRSNGIETKTFTMNHLFLELELSSWNNEL